jgi:hypothetical protein
MKLFYFSLILFFVYSATYAQTNYHPGYIVKNSGDTIKGYINYHEWTKSPRTIDFKTSVDEKKVFQFSPVDVKAFVITGMENFVSYTGYISANKTRFPDYPQQLDTSKVLDTVFLQQMATGKNATLYYNSDELKTHFFIAETGKKPVELKYYLYYNETNQVVTDAVYTRQLMLYITKFAPDNNKLINSLRQMDYDQNHLEAFVNGLNNIDGRNVGAKKAKSVRFFIGAAVNSTTTEYSQYSGDQKSTSISPKINFGVDLFNNPNVQQLIFRAEVSFWYAMPRFNTNTNIDYTPAITVYEFNQYNATITPQILLNVYNKDNFKLYIDGGWSFNFSSYTNDITTVKNQDAAVTAANTVKKPLDLIGFWSSFPVQAGVVVNKKWEIYASYSFYSAFTNYEGLSIANQVTNIGIKLLLK